MNLSVIICTYNGSRRIKATLDSLGAMSLPSDVRLELIVVDNNSSDDTREVVEHFATTSGFPVRYLFERNQGLAHARNAGVRSAKHAILAFTDDDCIVDYYWLAAIVKEFTSDPDLSGLGGRVELYNKNDMPVTTRTYKEKILFSSPRQLFNLIPGCNMSFARTVFEATGEFDPNFGAGTKLSSAEDSDFFYRALKKGFKIIYSPDVLVYHNHGRCTEAQVQALNRGYVIGRGAFYCKHILKRDGVVLKLACREIYGRTKKLVKNLLAGESTEKEVQFFRSILIGIVYKLTTT